MGVSGSEVERETASVSSGLFGAIVVDFEILRLARTFNLSALQCDVERVKVQMTRDGLLGFP